MQFALLAGSAVSLSALSGVPNVVVAHAGLNGVLQQEFRLDLIHSIALI